MLEVHLRLEQMLDVRLPIMQPEHELRGRVHGLQRALVPRRPILNRFRAKVFAILLRLWSGDRPQRPVVQRPAFGVAGGVRAVSDFDFDELLVRQVVNIVSLVKGTILVPQGGSGLLGDEPDVPIVVAPPQLPAELRRGVVLRR